MKSLLVLAALTATTVAPAFGQAKMIVGKRHTIFVEIPQNWLPAQSAQLPFFIKPDAQGVSQRTYMYVYGLDYDSQPKLSGWISGNNEAVLATAKGAKIDSLNLKFDNIKPDGYATGRYQVITYAYPGGRKEALLIVECRNTIATVVLSTNTPLEFETYFKSFLALAKSFKIMGSTLKEE